ALGDRSMNPWPFSCFRLTRSRRRSPWRVALSLEALEHRWLPALSVQPLTLLNTANAMGAFSPVVQVGGLSYFTAGDGVHGVELWRSNGTAAGTFMVKDIRPSGDSFPFLLTNVSG